MGSFSWTRAEATTKRANLTCGDKYKILVPIEFGGGYIRDIYTDYGEVFDYRSESDYPCYIDGSGKKYLANMFPLNDLTGILAYWNRCDGLKPLSEQMPKTMVEILLYGDTIRNDNRIKGIWIDHPEREDAALEYPLKLVSASYKGTYESCAGVSYGDPNQGFFRAYWSRDKYYRELRERLASEKKKKVAVDIRWDTDGISIDDLPERVVIEEDINDDEVADYLSDIYGWCVNSFKIEEERK